VLGSVKKVLGSATVLVSAVELGLAAELGLAELELEGKEAQEGRRHPQ